jgi:hypothetical protein
VPHDLEIRGCQIGLADPGGNVGGIVAEPMMAAPVAGQPVAREIDGHHVPARCRECGANTPPDPG